MLTSQLPPESAYMTALREDSPDTEPAKIDDDVYGPWSSDQMLLAALVDGVNILAWQQVVINQEKNAAHPAPPTPIRRPGIKPKASGTISDKAREYLTSVREKWGGEG